MHMELEAVKLSPRARSALRGALKESLGKVKKKIRTIRAKKMDGSYEDEDVKTFNELPTGMIEKEATESPEDEAKESPEEMTAEEEAGIETPEDHTKAQREAFFRKSNRPKVGKVKEAVGMGPTLASAEKDFGRKNKMTRNPSFPGRKGGEVRSSYSVAASMDRDRSRRMT